MSPIIVLSDRYRLIDRLATGGQGEVWRGEDTALDRPVAVKVLRQEYADDAEFLARFRREALNAAVLSHPGLAQVYDYGDGQGEEPPYLVMEFIEGEPLSTVIARAGALPPARVVDIVARTAEALAAAHTTGLVHRDVKPGNLMICPNGAVKVTDFGIARAIDATPLTRTNVILGTPLYLSPEQARGVTAKPASDIYSLGVVAYECLTGRPPFEGNAAAVTVAHRDQPLPPLPGTVPGAVRDLVVALTDKDPAHRPSALAVVEWVRELSSNPAALAQPGPPPQAPRPRAPQHDHVQPARVGNGAPPRPRPEPAGRRPAGPRTTRVGPPPVVGPQSPPRSGPAGSQTVGMPTVQLAPPPAPGGRSRPASSGRRRLLMPLLAGAAVALLLGGLVWLLQSPSAPPAPKAAPTHAAEKPSPAPIMVNPALYEGRAVGDVVHDLEQLGLKTVTTYQTAAKQPRDTVLRVTPVGQVPPDTVVTVVGTRKPPAKNKHGKHDKPKKPKKRE